MRTFKRIFLLPMIFLLGSNVNAMNVGFKPKFNAKWNYKNNSYYDTLTPKDKLAIDNLHTMLSILYKNNNRNHSQNDFIEILCHINNFIESYNNTPNVKRKIIRVIGISNFKNGYIVNINLFSQFLCKCKSRINLNFQKIGFTSSSFNNAKEHLQQIIGYVNGNDIKIWTVRLPNLTSNTQQNSQSLSSNLTNVPSERQTNQYSLVQQNQLINSDLQSNRLLDITDEFDFLQHDDPFANFFYINDL